MNATSHASMNPDLMIQMNPPNPTLETLHAWADQGWLRRLDSAMAEFVHKADSKARPAALVATALLAHMEGRGHTCLPLSSVVSQPQGILGWPDKAQGELQRIWADLPADLGLWVEALQALGANRVVRQCWSDGHSDDGTNCEEAQDRGELLVLGGTRTAPLLYLRRYWLYERQVSRSVNQRASQLRDVDTSKVRRWLDRLFVQSIPQPETDWQKVACALAVRSGLTVITGGPGTGKTYTAARLLALILGMSEDPGKVKVALAAPTGKAAARLRQSIDQSLGSLQASLNGSTDDVHHGLDLKALMDRIGKASTLHSLLGMHTGSRQFRHDARHPLDVDVLIIDETSMIHLEMMAALLEALPQQAMLVLLGDKDQLASVEAGSVLGDLCAHAHQIRYNEATRLYLAASTGEVLPEGSTSDGSEITPLDQQTVMLRHSRRFGTTIGAFAKAVNEGDSALAIRLFGGDEAQEIGGLVWRAPTPITPQTVLDLALQGRPGAAPSYADYLQLIKAGPAKSIAADAKDMAQGHADWVKRVLRAFDNFRILCAVHEGEWGDVAINQGVQRELARKGLLNPDGEWFVGRPVMVTRNDKALGVFNGDVGVVLPSPIGSALRAYFLDGDDMRSVAVSRLAHVETAFAMTIHKSQGSEFAHTVVVLPEIGGEILTRELVYTGITRAKQFLSLVEPRPGLLSEAIGKRIVRATGLHQH